MQTQPQREHRPIAGPIAILALVPIIVMTLLAPSALAADGLVRTTWPSAEDPGLPFYARLGGAAPPLFYQDGEWAAVVFYRDPGCVREDFNLLLQFDVPGAFACPHTVSGFHLWHGEAFNGSPKAATITGTGVPVWFAPVDAVSQAVQDGVLTIGELASLEGLVVGHADRFNEAIHPHPLPPELGGGGHATPKLTLNAHGRLEDGRRFDLHIAQVFPEIHALRIEFR